MKRLAIHKLRDRYFTPIFYTTYNAQFAHDYRLLCFQMYFRTRTGTMEPTKSHKVALINHSAILHLSRSSGVNGYVCNRFCFTSSLLHVPQGLRDPCFGSRQHQCNWCLGYDQDCQNWTRRSDLPPEPAEEDCRGPPDHHDSFSYARPKHSSG